MLKQVSDDSGDGTGRQWTRAESGDAEVPHHHTAVALTDIGAEGGELHLLQLSAGATDHREGLVGVCGGVPMTREVLRRGEEAIVLETLGVGKAHADHEVGRGTEASVADDRVGGVAIDIQDGGKVDVDADAARLLCRCPTVLISQSGIVGGAEEHIAGPLHRVGEAHREPPLAIHSHQHRHACLAAHPIGEPNHILGAALLPEDAAKLPLQHLSVPVVQSRLVHLGPSHRHDQLGRLLSG